MPNILVETLLTGIGKFRRECVVELSGHVPVSPRRSHGLFLLRYAFWKDGVRCTIAQSISFVIPYELQSVIHPQTIESYDMDHVYSQADFT